MTNFLGGHHGKVKADVRWLRLRNADRVLLCSDGLHDMVDDESISRIMGAHAPPRDAAQKLLDEALARGGRDNVTAIVACYQIPSLVSATDPESAHREPEPLETTDSIDTVPEPSLTSFF